MSWESTKHNTNHEPLHFYPVIFYTGALVKNYSSIIPYALCLCFLQSNVPLHKRCFLSGCFTIPALSFAPAISPIAPSLPLSVDSHQQPSEGCILINVNSCYILQQRAWAFIAELNRNISSIQLRNHANRQSGGLGSM